MSESEALAQSSGWCDATEDLVGYLPLSAANRLVGTGRYVFWQASPWGYVVRRKT